MENVFEMFLRHSFVYRSDSFTKYELHCGREYFKGNYYCMVQDICRIIIDEKEDVKFEEVVQYWFEEVVVNDEVGKVWKHVLCDVERGVGEIRQNGKRCG